MNQKFIDNIYLSSEDITKYWKQTLLYKLGKKKPSQSWIIQKQRILERKVKKELELFFQKDKPII